MTKNKKLLLIAIAVLIAVACTTGGTLAYLMAGTPSVDNTFRPVYVSCSVEEQFDGVTKTDVKIKNTGDINAYIRATFVVMWVADNGSVLGDKPVLGTDYTIDYGSANWLQGSDGFYYYNVPVSAGDTTAILLDKVILKGEAPEGYSLTVHVAATAIQAEPAAAVTEAWGVQLNSNGSLIAP